ncbi:hypothetical protein CHH55_20430 [Niallia circulans]|uniref:DUF5694 domain-containing protein n=1 Tax=Niallia circulans TaxID=1397 RepID=UPI000BA6DEDB|nr:DUF5694 domain-containing protein [Niallia circulans]PAD86075.1 hypothetical protein CHH55_20430 [Niallia circulans]
MRKKIILVGTFHFAENADMIKRKNEEIEALVQLLAEWRPSKIALEWDKKDEQLLIEKFHQESNQYSSDEIEQIGFRLANKLHHDKVYGVNWEGELGQEDVQNLFNEIKENYLEISEKMESLNKASPVLSATSSLIEAFRRLNENAYIHRLEDLYLSFVLVENKQGVKIGIPFLDKWMKRELYIFNNVLEITKDNDQDCILLLIGSDHLWLLRKFFEGIGWEVINPFSCTNKI